MLRFRLHPTPRGFVLGIAMIAFWALLWLWFLYSVGESRPRQARAAASPSLSASLYRDAGAARLRVTA